METFEQYAERLSAEAESYIEAQAPHCYSEVSELFDGESGVDLLAKLHVECARLYAAVSMACQRPDLFAARYELESLRDIYAKNAVT